MPIMSPNNTIDTTDILRHISSSNLSRRKTLFPRPANQASRQQPQQSYETNDDPSVSSIDSQDENLLMSTKHNFDEDSHLLPKMQSIRDTAQKYRSWRQPEPQTIIPTSAVNRAFKDFDLEDMPVEEEGDESIEIGRGFRGVVDGTPSKLGGSDVLLQMNDSFYSKAGTPQSRPRPKTRRSDGPERTSLRKDATLRRASAAVMETSATRSPNKANTPGKRIDSMSDMFYKTAHQVVSSAPASAMKSARVRVASSNRQHPGDVTGYGRASSEPPMADQSFLTPRRNNYAGTPRSMVNTTANSFALPELSGLTNMIMNPTVQSARSYKFPNPALRRNAPAPNYANVGGYPVPDEELQINEGLQQIHQKLADEQYERENAERKVTELELELIELRNALDSQEAAARKTSKIEDGGANGGTKWRMEKSKFEASQKTLQLRLDNTTKRADQAQATIHRLMSERDSALSELAAAGETIRNLEEEYFQYQEEQAALEEDHGRLQAENAELRLDLEQLQADRDDSHIRHEAANQRQSQKAATTAQRTAVKQARLQAQVELKDNTIQSFVNAALTAATTHNQNITQTTRHKFADKTALLSEQDELVRRLAETRKAHDDDSKDWRAKEDLLEEQLGTVRSAIGRVQTTRKSLRAVSAPQPLKSRSRSRSRARSTAAVDVEDDDSTTDLNLIDVRRPATVTTSAANKYTRSKSATLGAARVDSHQPSPIEDDDHTELSDIDAAAVADLRRRLEEERSARRQKRNHSRTRSPAKHALQARVEDETLEHEIPAPSDIASSIDSESETKSEDDEETGALRRGDILDEGTRHSRVSVASSSRRRVRDRASSATRGMTSAFIIPDITLDAAQLASLGNKAAAPLGPDQHNPASCTICQQGKEIDYTALPPRVPITHRPLYNPTDIDCTIRPSQPPYSAIQRVIKSLQDEYAHYQIKLTSLQQELGGLDPAMSKRKHDRIYEQMQRVTEILRAKAGQIYGAFDALEGMKRKRVGFEEEGTGVTWEGFGGEV